MRRLGSRLASLLAFAPLACQPSADPGSAPQGQAGGTPALAVSPVGQLDFGEVPSHGAARRALVISSVGAGPLDVRGLSFVGAHPERWGWTSPVLLPVTLPPGQQLTLDVEHHPCGSAPTTDACSCPVGADSALLRLDTSDPAGAATLALFATAARPPGLLEAAPPAVLELVEGATAALSLVNLGCEPVTITRAHLTGPDGVTVHGASRDVRLEGCDSWPCNLDIPVCGQGGSECPGPTVLELTYQNRDPITESTAELHLQLSGADLSERVWLVRARDGRDCPVAEAWIDAPEPPCVGRRVTLEAQASLPMASVEWRFLFAQPDDNGLQLHAEGNTVDFVPGRPGLYIVAADVQLEEACVASVSAVETVNVAASCP